MTATYSLVGCGRCEQLWIVEDFQTQATTTCPDCGLTHATNKLRVLEQDEEIAVVREQRSRRLAARAGELKRYQENGTYVDLEEWATERLQRYVDAFAGEIEQRLEHRTEAFSTAAEAASTRIEDAFLRARLGVSSEILDEAVNISPGGTDREARLLGFSSADALAAAADDTHDYIHDFTARKLGFESHQELESVAMEKVTESADPTDSGEPSCQDGLSVDSSPGECVNSNGSVALGESSERCDDETTGIRFVRRGEQPPVSDVMIKALSPRVSEWLPTLLNEDLSRTAETVRREIETRNRGVLASKRLPQSLVRTLSEEAGITAQRGTYADTIANYALWFAPDAMDHQTFQDTAFRAEKWEQEWRKQLTSIGQRGGSGDVALGDDWYHDLINGPLAVHELADQPGTYVIHPDEEAWLDANRQTLQTTLNALAAIAKVDRVYVVLPSVRLLRALEERFGDYLADVSNLTDFMKQARDHGLADVDTETPTDAELAHEWVASTSDGHQEVRVLDALADAPDHTLSIETILADPEVDISENSVYAVNNSLVDAGVVAYHKRTSYSDSSRLVLTAAGELAVEYIGPEYALADPLSPGIQTRLTASHIRDEGAVESRGAGSGGGDQPGHPVSVDGRRSPEAWLAKRGGEAFNGADEQYVQWLDGPGGSLDAFGMHRRYTAPATGRGVWLADDRIERWNGRDDDAPGDGRAVFVSNAVDGELLVLFQWAYDPLVSLGRIANALLSNRVTARVLNKEIVGPEFEKLYDSAYDEFVDSLEDLHTDLVRDSVQVGWWGDDQHTWNGWRARWSALRPQLNERVGKLAGTEEWDERGELMADLHGMIASLTQLLFAAGQDVVFNARVPNTADLVEDEFYRRWFLDFLAATVPKQAVYKSETGFHSWYRQTCEQRPAKLKWRRPPGIDGDYPTATLTASWIITGPGATGLQDDVQRAIDRGVRERADGKRAPPALEIPVKDATQPEVVRKIVDEFATVKNYRVADIEASTLDKRRIDSGKADDVTRLLRVLFAALGTDDRPLSCSPYDVTETLLHIASSSKIDDYLRIRDLEYGLSQLPPERFLPSQPASTAAFVQALLAADDPLRRGEVCDRAEFSTRSWEERKDDLLGLGIIEPRREGRHPHYTATLEPWWSPESPRSKPPNIGEIIQGDDDMDDAWDEGGMLWEISIALDLPIWHDDVFLDGIVSVDEIYATSAVLRSWRPIVTAAYAGREELLGLPPPPEQRTVVVIGRYPDGAESRSCGDADPQVTLPATRVSSGSEVDNRKITLDVGRSKNAILTRSDGGTNS